MLLKGAPKGRSASRKIDILYDKGAIVGERYVETLGRSKVMVAGSSVYKYPLLRYFEGMACKTAVVGDGSAMLDRCGLRNVHEFWQSSRKSWVYDVRTLLRDEAFREFMVEKAYKAVFENHSAEVRAKQMLEHMKEYS